MSIETFGTSCVSGTDASPQGSFPGAALGNEGIFNVSTPARVCSKILKLSEGEKKTKHLHPSALSPVH